MINVSSKFRTNISTFPRAISASADFAMVDVAAQNNCVDTANFSATVGDITQITNGVTQLKKYMSWENNYTCLDGTFYTPPKQSDVVSNIETGWWSSAMSDISGNFAVTYPTVTLTLSTAFTASGLTLLFSPLSLDYCTLINIQTTNNLASVVNYNGIVPTSSTFFWSQQLTNITKVVITFLATNNPYRRVHLVEVIFGQLFAWTTSNMFEMDILEEIDPLGNTAPPKELALTIANSLNSFNIYLGNLQKKQPIRAYLTLVYTDRSYEIVPMGTFYLYNWRNDDNYLSSTLYARDLLELASGTSYFKYAYTGTPITLYDLALAVITDLQALIGTKFSYKIDTALQSITTLGNLNIMSHHDALMMIAQAGMAIVYIDRYNVLQITQSKSMIALNTMPYSAELTLNMQETYPKMSIQDLYNYFACDIVSINIVKAKTNLYSGSFNLNGTDSFLVLYTTPADSTTCTCTIGGSGSLSAATYYTNCAYLTIIGTGIVTVSIDGKILDISTLQDVNDLSSGTTRNSVIISNTLLSDHPLADTIINWIAAECLNTYLYEVESWMNMSLECGDLITWDNQYYTGSKIAKIIRQNFRFNGTLSGTINGKGI